MAETSPSADFVCMKKELLSRVFFFGLLILAVYISAPSLFDSPRLRQEESSVYFQYAWDAPWLEALLSPHLGYYSLWPNLATVIAANLLPLEVAPYVTLAFSVLASLLVSIVILSDAGPFKTPLQKLLGVCIFLLVIPNGKYWLLTINSQFQFAAMTGLLLISRPQRWQLIMLLIAGLSGVVATFLAPLFLLKARQEKSMMRAIQAAVLGACGCLQLLIFLQGYEQSATRFAPFDISLLLTWWWNKLWVLTFLGPKISTGSQAQAILGLIGTAVAATLMIGRTKHREGIWLVAAMLLMGTLSFLAGTDGSADHSKMGLLTSHERYSHAPQLFFLWALLLQLFITKKQIDRLVYGLLVTWVLIVGLWYYLFPAVRVLQGPHWRDQVAIWRHDPTHLIVVWPEKWPPLKLAPQSLQ